MAGLPVVAAHVEDENVKAWPNKSGRHFALSQSSPRVLCDHYRREIHVLGSVQRDAVMVRMLMASFAGSHVKERGVFMSFLYPH